jgi:L-ascorbate metabolism protein UlaG (beta-lactamase superfamily)
MEITWFGHSCFQLKERDMATVVTDPYDFHGIGYQQLKLSADIVTVSHDMPGHNHLPAISDDPFIITGPGEYEIGNVFITGVPTQSKRNGNPNTLYVFDYDGINIAHLGDLNRVPNQAEVEALGPIHVALVPVGGGSSLNAYRAAEVISLLEPNIIIPMHYATPVGSISLDPINRFLKEMGLTEVETMPSFRLSSSNQLPEDTQVIILDYPGA